MAPAEAWLLMTGTMEQGKRWYSQLAKEWGIAGPDKDWIQMKSAGNPYTFPGGEESPELLLKREEMPLSLYQERFEGIPMVPTGLVFPEFMPDLHVSSLAEYEPGRQVQIWEDPGYGSDSAHVLLAAHIIDGQVRVFDEIYVNGIATETIIRDIFRQKEWAKDTEVRVPDPHYSDQKHAGTDSVNEIWRKLEPRLKTAGKRERLNPRLERVRSMLIPTAQGAPKIIIHPKCQGILSEVGLCFNPIDKLEHVYMYKVDHDGQIVGDEPIDKFNHAWEALGRGLYYNFGPVGDVARGQKRKFRTQFFGREAKRART